MDLRTKKNLRRNFANLGQNLCSRFDHLEIKLRSKNSNYRSKLGREHNN